MEWYLNTVTTLPYTFSKITIKYFYGSYSKISHASIITHFNITIKYAMDFIYFEWKFYFTGKL